MKKTAFILLLNLIAFFTKAQTDTAWITTYGGIQSDWCQQVMATYDSGYITVGTTNSFGCGNTSIYVIKTDSLCKKQWSKTYGGAVNQAGYSVAPTFDHGYAFVGYTDSYDSGNYQAYLVRTDSAGNVKWQKTYGGKTWSFGYSIAETPDSGFVICGLTYNPPAINGDVYVVRTDRNGDTLWTRTIGGNGYDVGNSVYVHSKTLYAIVGSTTSFGLGDTNMYVILLDNKGNKIKDTTLSQGKKRWDVAYSITGTNDGGLLILGNTDSLLPIHPSQIIYKIDSTIKVQWVNECGNVNQGRAVVQSPDGNIVTVGTTNYFGAGGFDMAMYHLQFVGGWLIGSTSEGRSNDEYGNSLAIGKNGNVVFAGATNSFGQGLFDVYLVRVKNDSIKPGYDTVGRYYHDTSVCASLSLTAMTSIEPDVMIYPNPMVSLADIIVQGTIGQNYKFYLFDLSGRCLMQDIPVNTTSHGQSIGHISRGNLVSGMYFYQINNQDGRVASGKLLVE